MLTIILINATAATKGKEKVAEGNEHLGRKRKNSNIAKNAEKTVNVNTNCSSN